MFVNGCNILEICSACGVDPADRLVYSERTIAVLAFCRHHGRVSPSEVSREFGIPANRAQAVLSRLVDRGKLTKVARGVYVSGAPA